MADRKVPGNWPKGWPRPTPPQVEVLRALVEAKRAGRRPVLSGRRGGAWMLADEPRDGRLHGRWSTVTLTVRSMAKHGFLRKIGDGPDWSSEFELTDIGEGTLTHVDLGEFGARS